MSVGTAVSRMYGRLGHFKPTDEYCKKGGRLLEYSSGLRVKSTKLEWLIILDNFLRETMQRIDWLEQNIRPLQKGDNKDDLSTIRAYEKEIAEQRRSIPELDKTMYYAEVELPESPLKRTYDKIRRNPTWYLCEELTKDCIGRGGCCGRKCRCCEHRHLSQSWRKGLGHCTIECWCCEVSRGFEMTREEKEQAIGDFCDSIQSENPSYLLALAEPYFCMPGMFGLGRISFIRTIAWHWKKGVLWQWKRATKWFK